MQSEKVTVVVGAARYDSWKRVSIHASVKKAARSFSLTVAAEYGAAATNALFQDQAPITIFGGGDLIFTGFVNERCPSLGPTQAEITIGGEAKGADAIDCSVDHTKPDYTDKTLLQIAQDQDAFGIGFSSDMQLQPIDRTRPMPGETLFRFLETLSRDQAATLFGQADGSIKITQAGANPPRQPGGLFEGLNIQHGTASHCSRNRHSHVHVHGQGYKGTGTEATQIHAMAADSSIGRYRPIHVIHRGHATKGRVKSHATHRRDREAGDGLRATIRTPGWRDETGALWTPGNKVWTQSAFLDLTQDMLIEAVDYEQEAEGAGTFCALHLVDPRAHGGQGGGINKSGGDWSFDDGEAEG